jgi:single-strand DNA-binding protein
MYLNKAFVYGNLTRDPELRSLPSGVQVTSFSIATNRVYRDQNNERQESTEFHNIVVFGRQAENCAQYLGKGSSALVEGRLQTRSWEQDGQKKYRTEIVADNVQFGPKGGNTGSGGESQQGQAQKQGAAQQGSQTPGQNAEENIQYPEENINPEDIPF